MKERVSVVFALIVDLCLKRGFRDIQGQVVEIEFSEIWKVTINAKREPHQRIPPLHALVTCNGWPATIIGPSGGGPLLGVEEYELIDALKAAGAELPPEEPTAPEMQQQEIPYGKN